MKQTCRLLIIGALLLAGFSDSAVRVKSKDAPFDIPPTVAGRRQLLAELVTEREQARSAGDRALMVQLGNRIVELHLKLCELDSALTESSTSLQIARELPASDVKLFIDTLVLSARVHISRTESPLAVPLLMEARSASVQLGDRHSEARSNAELALAYYELDERVEAAARNDDALRLSQELQDKRGEARALIMQGDLLLVGSKHAEAAVAFKNGELIWRALNDAPEIANALVDQNFLANQQGQWQTALALLNEAQSLVVDADAEPYLAGKISNSFGEIYEAYGQLDTSLSYYREALRLYRDSAHDVRAAVTAGIKIGRVQARLSEFVAAREQIQQSLNDAMTTSNALTIGLCHEDLGRVWLEAADYESARLEFQRAISYFTQSNAPRPLARAETYLGQTYHLSGNLAQAGESYQRALKFFTETLDYTNEAALRFGLGKLAMQEGRLADAKVNLSRSIELTERLRENASSRDLKSSFLDSVHDRYETYVEWLMTSYLQDRNQQHAVEAFEVVESGRARSLLDVLSRNQRELRQPSNPSLLLEEAQLQKDDQQLVDKSSALVSRGATEAEKTAVDRQRRDLHVRLETLEARINTSAKFKDLLRPQSLSYERIRADITDDETSLLSYSLGDRKSFAWVVTKDGLTTYELADKKTIRAAANQLIERLKTPQNNDSDEAELKRAISEVSRLVIEPLAGQLLTSRLIIVPDGVLQYVPFNILQTSPSSNEPMIAKFDVVEAPSASALAVVRRERMNRKPNPKLLIGFGDAVFSPDYSPQAATANADSREARAQTGSRFGKLPPVFNAKRELDAISELAGPDSAFYVAHDATRDHLLKADLKQYRILHVVTHGILDDKEPELSGLLLSMVDENARPISGFVSLADIYKLDAPVDLVVLSACHTALGQELRGEGLVGLTRGFMYAGASGVVASLWKVDDRATAELMKSFYTNMLQRGMEPSAALRAAQNEIRSQPKWSSPYYWAGFTFQGDYDLTIRPTSSSSRFTQKQMVLAVAGILAVALFVYLVYFRRRRYST